MAETHKESSTIGTVLAEQDCHLARVKVKGSKMLPGAIKFPVLVENSAPESRILAPVSELLVQES